MCGVCGECKSVWGCVRGGVSGVGCVGVVVWWGVCVGCGDVCVWGWGVYVCGCVVWCLAGCEYVRLRALCHAMRYGTETLHDNRGRTSRLKSIFSK